VESKNAMLHDYFARLFDIYFASFQKISRENFLEM
jgi:hypothetical protein